jgi:hypothetical protein
MPQPGVCASHFLATKLGIFLHEKIKAFLVDSFPESQVSNLLLITCRLDSCQTSNAPWQFCILFQDPAIQKLAQITHKKE